MGRHRIFCIITSFLNLSSLTLRKNGTAAPADQDMISGNGSPVFLQTGYHLICPVTGSI